jgi:glycosyltransferase involved in cell wall biosynthesis
VSAPDPMVTLIVPCRNERHHIRECLGSLLANDYPVASREILVVDGMSDDGTREILAGCVGRHPDIHVLDNPRRITSTALNIGVTHARGSVVMLIGAHSVYPRSYIRDLVRELAISEADGVGGVCTTSAGGRHPVATAIAVALAHPFGVGNSWFRIGSREPRWVDTVPFGCYRRDVFDRIGGFDEELVRNQDDEFNLRLLRRGGRLRLIPAVASRYYARTSLGQLGRMFYQYGLYKPLVIRKVGAIMTLRQLVPAAFVLSLAASVAIGAASPALRALPAGIALAYAAAAFGAAIGAVGHRGVRCALALLVVFPVIHLSYGFGFLLGLLRLPLRGHGLKPAAAVVPLSR